MFKDSKRVINDVTEQIVDDINSFNITDIDDIKQAIKDDISEYILGTYTVPNDSSEYYDFTELYNKFIDENAERIYKENF